MTDQWLFELTVWLLIISVPGLLCIAGYLLVKLATSIRVWWREDTGFIAYDSDRTQVRASIHRKNRD